MKNLYRLSKIVPLSVLAGATWLATGLLSTAEKSEKEGPRALRVLHLTGGCCHDYEKQKLILTGGIAERANVEFEIVHEGGTGTKHEFEMLKKEGWEKDYDAVLYNICFAHTENAEYIDSITKVHESGLPAVALHCTLHTYHWKAPTDSWEQFLGVTSPRHGAKHAITVKKVAADHPIMKTFPDEWTTPQGELYHIDKVWDTATVLADGTIDGGKSKHAVMWVNEFGKGRLFGTSIGHHNETMMEDNYLDVVTNGLLWACGKLSEDGTASPGYGREPAVEKK